MFHSKDRYYWYRSFDYSIKIKIVFRRRWAFFRRHGKKRQKAAKNSKKRQILGKFFERFDRLIDTIDSVCIAGSMAISQRRLL
jgi:hypothetical protein